MSTLRVNNLTAVGGTGTITVPTGNSVSQTDQPQGMVKVYKTTFTSASSVQMPTGSFSSTYDFYRVILSISGNSANCSIGIRVNSSGSPRTATSYFSQFVYSQDNGYNNLQNTVSGSSITIGGVNTANGLYSNIFDVLNPTDAGTYTRLVGNASVSNSAVTLFVSGSWGGIYNATEAHDGITIVPSTGTITGKLAVYGYGA